MDQQKLDVIEKLKTANNILVTVSSNPSVDQLAACIGMTVLLNKLKKHATAVFSGHVPSTIEFLKPEETLEKNTDSLRDFIISLDKSKADKLRYKVEDQVVRIFITPYKTSINQEDLDFSQGDFNVDVVLCLGVNQQQDLDQAITTHGRILHDAVIASINTHQGGELGTINWTDTSASSLSELVTIVCDELGKDLMDAQIATALLTGIVAETERFSNEKTSPNTMRLSAELMSAGANQQLVANELALPEAAATEKADDNDDDKPVPPKKKRNQDGTLEISHTEKEPSENPEPPQEAAAPRPELPEPVVTPFISNIRQDTFNDVKAPLMDADNPESSLPPLQPPSSEISATPASRIMLQPPSLGGTLTANSTTEQENDMPDVLAGLPANDQPILSHSSSTAASSPPKVTESPLPAPTSHPKLDVDMPKPLPPLPEPEVEKEAEPLLPEAETPELIVDQSPPVEAEPTVPPAQQIQIDANGNLQMPNIDSESINNTGGPRTLSELEESVHSSHVDPSDTTNPAETTMDQDIEAARGAVTNAINSAPLSGSPEPKADVGASGYLHVQPPSDDATAQVAQPTPDLTESAAAALPIEQPTAAPSPVSSFGPFIQSEPPTTPSSTASSSTVPPPVPPPLPLDDLSQFTNPSNNSTHV
jgi:nanoRNase/pAp phosphatase (c-di-AMP/oligoRNAs hydrolase)